MITYEQIKQANEAIIPISMERKDKKTGKVTKKDYAEVNQRIKAFRMVYPEGFITTDIRENGDICSCCARVGYYTEDGHQILIGTGHAREEKTSFGVNQTSHVENCETSAVGRALGMAGFGIDTSVASAEEVETAQMNQTGDNIAPNPMKKVIVDKCLEHGIDIDKWLKQGGVKSLEDLTVSQATQMIDTIRRLYGDEEEKYSR